TLRQYLNICVSDVRINQGQLAMVQHQNTFDTVEQNYGVDRHIVAAIWGMETNYGKIRGSIPVLSALATLAHSGRRRALFESQLLAALDIVQRGIRAPNDMIGSWAGAMGHTQFMPTSYRDFAVSLNNGMPNIWSDDPGDALASTAHYLTCHGWVKDRPWGKQAIWGQNVDLHSARHSDAQSLADWTSTDVTPIGQAEGEFAFILPGGIGAPAFLVTENYRALLAYNNAAAYAVAVGHLADRLAGGSDFEHSWNCDHRGLTQAEVQQVQIRLTALGFDTQGSDGFPGPNTSYAVEAYQVDQNLPVDGFVGLKLLTHLGCAGES
ncbi:MAG: lytic murein transglycosylase, partial [Planktomarina sp.]